MKILVTGSSGQLGQTFQNVHSKNYNYCFSNRFDFNFLDKNDILKFLEGFNPDIIINCAAYTSVDDAENQTELALLINYEAVKVISKWVYENNAFLIHFSTDYIFDGKKDLYYENDIPNPLSIYGKSKLYGEISFLESNANGICLRTSWVHSNYGKNFFLTIKNLLLKNEIINVVNDQKGIPTTTEFLVRITQKLIDMKLKGIVLPKLLNVCPSGSATWHDFAIFILKNLANNKKLNLKCKKIVKISSKEFPQEAKRPKNSVLSNKKLAQLINIELDDWSDEHKKLYENL